MTLNKVSERELSQARERFTLPPLVWDVFEGITQEPKDVGTQAPVNDQRYWYEQSLQYYPNYTPPFDERVDYDSLYSHLFYILNNLKALFLQPFIPTTLAKQINQERHRIFTLVYPVTLQLHYIATPFEKAFIDPDVVIRQLDKLVLIGVSDRLSYLGPLPDIIGKARVLEEKKITPMEQGSVQELKRALPGKYYTIASSGLISFLKEAKRVGYLQQVTNEFVVDDSNRELVQGLSIQFS